MNAPASIPETAAEPAIRIRDLVKRYAATGKAPAKLALEGVSFDVPRGEIFGLLGPNGAGKSTLINTLAGLVLKTSGTVEIWGHDIDADRRNAKAAIGIVPQEIVFDPFFTPIEVLDIQAGLYGVPKHLRRSMELLRAVHLADKAKAYSRSLSGGMKRRLLIAKAMVHTPPVLVLDEPTAGVDVELRQQLWAYVRQLNRAGTTVLLTTHYLEEAEELCDRIAIIAGGRVIACDTTSALLSRLDSKALTLVLDRPLAGVPPALARFEPAQPAPNVLAFRYRPSLTACAEILDAAQSAGLTIVDLSTDEADLEDIFLQLVRQAAE